MPGNMEKVSPHLQPMGKPHALCSPSCQTWLRSEEYFLWAGCLDRFSCWGPQDLTRVLHSAPTKGPKEATHTHHSCRLGGKPRGQMGVRGCCEGNLGGCQPRPAHRASAGLPAGAFQQGGHRKHTQRVGTCSSCRAQPHGVLQVVLCLPPPQASLSPV